MGMIKLPRQIDLKANLYNIQKRKCELSLVEFIKQAWHIIEPAQEYVHGWHIDFLCAHLEAITDGHKLENGEHYNRLLINIPPGTMKSLCVNVFWPAWEWGPKNKPNMRYVCASHNQDLAIRDNTRMRRLVESEWYQERWGDRVQLTKDQNAKTKFENTATGFRQAVAAGGITGARGDRVIIDDPFSVEDAASDAIRQSRKEWFLEAVPSRLNNPISSAIVVIMQRLHEEDTAGLILDMQLGYDHICLPMRFVPWRKDFPTKLGYVDPREAEGELLFPERFPQSVVDRDEKIMGPYATAGQFQQEPIPRGGGIIEREWWQVYESPDNTYPLFDYIVASLDTAYGEKTHEGDFSALTVWGVFSSDLKAQTTKLMTQNGTIEIERTYNDRQTPKVMLIYAYNKRVKFNELITDVAKICKDKKVDRLLVEGKASGLSILQELRRVYGHEQWAIEKVDPEGDKIARLYSVQSLFSDNLIYAPNFQWAEETIIQTCNFPKAKHDDLVDTVSMALRHLRKIGVLQRSEERVAEVENMKQYAGKPPAPLYAV
jgi:predicted phage terminase large subunit-like protein